ncbi:lysophospholipase L1-like esterase [Bradyrhizobium diazoefficiens]|uniref:SGNH/GDSL hydrolase family protein n=1 Tax=Bradyrhizobium diazoefficiens TaxID=1355477 RepID=UPI00351369AA
MGDQQIEWTVPSHVVAFPHPLPHLAKRLADGAPVKIVAIGSSSTAGEGGIVPYPARLELELRARFPGRNIDVLNRGVGGQEAPEELLRLETDVIAERPDLVIWQVGTNAAWKAYDLEDVAGSIRAGLARLGGQPLDVVLMDPQYVPALLKDDKIAATQRMVSLIGNAAATANVNVFRRFALMKHWNENDNVPFEDMVDPADNTRLHQSERSTAQIARALTSVISDAASSLDVQLPAPRRMPANLPTSTYANAASRATIVLLDDLLPSLFDSAVLRLTRRALLSVERNAVLTALVNSVGESVLRRIRSLEADKNYSSSEISDIETIDRFSDSRMSRAEIIECIANSSGLDQALCEFALFLMEVRLDVALSLGSASVAGIGRIRTVGAVDELRIKTAKIQDRIGQALLASEVTSFPRFALPWSSDRAMQRLLDEASLITTFRDPLPCKIALAEGLAFVRESREAEFVRRPLTERNRFRRDGPGHAPDNRVTGA